MVPEHWLSTRRIGHLALAVDGRWLDLRELETRVAVRRELASVLLARQLADFDLGDALARQRPLTQRIARWAYDAGYRGVAYTSRFGCNFDCWAIFVPTRVTAQSVDSISFDDSDLVEVVRLFDLRLSIASGS